MTCQGQSVLSTTRTDLVIVLVGDVMQLEKAPELVTPMPNVRRSPKTPALDQYSASDSNPLSVGVASSSEASVLVGALQSH